MSRVSARVDGRWSHAEWVPLGSAACFLLVLIAGCQKKESAPEIISLEGTVQKVELKSDGAGEITVEYYNEKQKQQQIGVGIVDRQTDIRVNGASATLADVRVGDRVRGDVRVAKVKNTTVQTVVKIQIDRAAPPPGE